MCEYALSEVVEIIGGGTPKTSVAGYWNGKIPWLSVKDFNNDLRYVYDSEKRITELGLNNSTTTLLQKDDIIISARGTVGELAMIPYPMAFNQSCYGIRAIKGKIDSAYLYYFLKDNVRILKKRTHGSVFDTITRKTFDELLIQLPDMERQQKASSILATLDDKIELNQKINKNLERQTQTLFANYYAQADEEICFTDMIQILGGGTPKTGERSYWNGEILFFTPKDVGSPYTLETEQSITEDGLSHCNSRLYPINTVFVTARGTVGKVCMSGVPMAMNQSCYALVGKTVSQLLVYFYTLVAVERLKHKASGAVFDAITTRDFKSERIFKLPTDAANSFLSLAEPVYKTILNNTIENQRLTMLRDALLPKLISRELGV